MLGNDTGHLLDLVRCRTLSQIQFIIEMIWWTGLAPFEFEFPFLGSLTSTFLKTGADLLNGVLGPIHVDVDAAPVARRRRGQHFHVLVRTNLRPLFSTAGFRGRDTRGRDTRQEDVEGSSTQSRISSSIQRICLRV
jgi:hypothetical protein